MTTTSSPGTYRKRPVDIEAVQFLGWRNAESVHKFCPVAFFVPEGAEHRLRRESERDPGNGHFYPERAPAFMVIRTLEGDMRADLRDWIIRGVEGEFYPCKPDIFAVTYDAV